MFYVAIKGVLRGNKSDDNAAEDVCNKGKRQQKNCLFEALETFQYAQFVKQEGSENQRKGRYKS